MSDENDERVTSSPAPSNEHHILVVGAGLAGLSLSLSLSFLGKNYIVHLLEIRDEFSAKAGATFGLAIPGQKALGQICPAALEAIRSKGILLPTGGYMIPWWEVRDELLHAVYLKRNQIHLHMGVTILEIIEDDDEQCVRVKYEQKRKKKELQGALLVGCDGVHSQVRQHLGLPPAEKIKNLWRGNIEVPPDCHRLIPLLEQGVTPLGVKKYGSYAISVFNFHETVPSTMAWTLVADDDDSAEVHQGTNVFELFERYIEVNEEKEIFKEIMALSKESDLCTALDYCIINPEISSSGSKGWGGRGRITLSGDAAHCQRATSGLGGSMAFEDQVVLARQIAAAGDVIDESVVARFEQERFPRVNRIWKDEWERAEYFYKTGEQKPKCEEYTEWVNAGI